MLKPDTAPGVACSMLIAADQSENPVATDAKDAAGVRGAVVELSQPPRGGMVVASMAATRIVLLMKLPRVNGMVRESPVLIGPSSGIAGPRVCPPDSPSAATSRAIG